MENKQQTAVDCLIEQLTNEGIYIPFGFYEQAKQMEKEQMIKFADDYGFRVCGYDYERAEQYYKETYGYKQK